MLMSKYRVDSDGVEALNRVASQVSEAGENIMNLAGQLESAASDNPGGLGPHASSLSSAIEEIRGAVSNAETPATEVSEGLRSLASKYQEIIDNDPFSFDSNVGNNEFFGFGSEKKQNRLDKEHINNEVLPNADVEIKNHIKSNGLEKYISSGKLNVSITDNTEALTPAEMKKEYGNGWQPRIMGFNNGKKSFIDTSYGANQAKETAIHENFHQLSANDVKDVRGNVETYRRGLSINGKDRGLNEALTQKYTIDTMRDTNPTYTNPNCAYDEASKYIDDLYSFGGNKDMFDQAYFQNNPSVLKRHFNQYGGDGFYDDLSANFDIAADNGYNQVDRRTSLNRIGDLINQYKLKRFFAKG